MLRRVRNTAGNVLLQIMVATAIMSSSFYFLTNYVVGQREQVSKTINLVNVRFALNSAMDYVIFGVRQKYCFSNDDMLLNDPTEKCTLRHDGSVERLIMSIEQENFIRELIAGGQSVGEVDTSNIRLAQIDRYVRINTASTSHPLFPVLQSLRMVKGADGKPVPIDGIRVRISRDDSVYLPRAGREVYATITVSLQEHRDGSPIRIGNKELSISSQIAVYPREVGSFAMLVPNDLRLDTTWDAQAEKGDVIIHKFGARSELGKSPGLVFMSPVFVNRNIHIAEDNGDEKADPSGIQYSGVTFADRVYLGNGWVMSNGLNYAPRTSGGTSNRFWADVRTFGGFLKGIENDGGLDAGLQYFAKILTGNPPSTDLMSRCIELTKRQSSREFLNNSKLGASISTSNNNEFSYRLQLSNGNYFNRQSNYLLSDTSKWGTGSLERLQGPNEEGLIKVRVDLADGNDPNGLWAETQIPADGKVVFRPQVGSPNLKANLESSLEEAKAAVSAANNNLSNWQIQINNAKDELASAEDNLQTEKNKQVKPTPAPPTPPPGGWRNDQRIAELEALVDQKTQIVSSLNSQKGSLEQAVTNAEKDQQNAQIALDKYNTILNNPPSIEMHLTRVNQWFFYAQDKLDLKIKFKNPTSFIDYKGKLITPVLKVLAYDGTFYKSKPIVSPANAKLEGYLNFSLNGNQLSPPSGLSKYPTSSAEPIENEPEDWAQLEKDCEEARNAAASQSFGGAGWSTSFAKGTRSSWNFAGGTSPTKDPGIDKLEIVNSTKNNASFQVRSIVGKCIIDSTSDFVTGFFTCDELEITARSKPLRIIGSFIVGKLRLHPDAIKAGITWSTIYHPQATRELRAAKILQSQSGADCNKRVDPIWHPIPSVQGVADRMSCNTISLRAKANPFQWTAVDPDCGILEGKSNTSCKKRLVRFFVVEQSREGAL